MNYLYRDMIFWSSRTALASRCEDSGVESSDVGSVVEVLTNGVGRVIPRMRWVQPSIMFCRNVERLRLFRRVTYLGRV